VFDRRGRVVALHRSDFGASSALQASRSRPAPTHRRPELGQQVPVQHVDGDEDAEKDQTERERPAELDRVDRIAAVGVEPAVGKHAAVVAGSEPIAEQQRADRDDDKQHPGEDRQ